MFTIFEKKCPSCGELFFGPREGGKAKGRWLGYDMCPDCRKKAEETPPTDFEMNE